MITDTLPRVALAQLPTPIEPLPRLSARLDGPEVWVKRDDQTGLATGGNKARKLEFLIAHALQDKADAIVTCGAAQSNHARQSAAAAAKFGLGRVLVLRGEEPSQRQGNLLLDHLLGAEIVWTGEDPPHQHLNDTADRLRQDGRRPYVVPYGGSNPVGVSGYVLAMQELLSQCDERNITFDRIVLASSSGGTQVGLVIGARALGYRGEILGISVDLRTDVFRETLSDLATSATEHLGLDLSFAAGDFVVNDAYVGGGYGVVSDLERRAIRTLARTEGLLLDPVYTGRAFGGLLDLIRCGAFRDNEKVLFWHTGGTGGLFGHAHLL